MKTSQAISLWRLLLKAALLFAVLNVLFAVLNPIPLIGQVSIYNRLVPGRPRLPYGDNPQQAYNLNLFSLEAMFASHELAGPPKADNEFRVLVLGDSSVWGFLLENEDTLTSVLNAANLQAADKRRVAFYNLGHPTISLTKDLMILDYAMRYEPDLILWPVTLEAFPNSKQTSSPLVQNNAARVADLISRYNLQLKIASDDLIEMDFWDRSIIGQHRNLADILRLQLYGFAWAGTGIDIHIPAEYEKVIVDQEADETYIGLQPPKLDEGELAMELLSAGIQRAGKVPVLFINEPIYVSDGLNSDLRYNSFYPRWAYRDYRVLMQNAAEEKGWNYVDLWQAADNSEFTNTPIHLTPHGTIQFAHAIESALQQQFKLQP